jgi:protein involved in ribonucleotide reduction
MDSNIRNIKDLTETIEKAKGIAIYFYSSSEEKKRFIKKYEELAKQINAINPKNKKIFALVNVDICKEIKDYYDEITAYPSIYIYYLSEQKVAFIPKDEKDLETQINKYLKTPELKA